VYSKFTRRLPLFFNTTQGAGAGMNHRNRPGSHPDSFDFRLMTKVEVVEVKLELRSEPQVTRN
jgi:hypothetical protein